MTTLKIATSTNDESNVLINRLFAYEWDFVATTNPVKGDEFPYKIKATGELPNGQSRDDFVSSITEGLKSNVE